ncbi:MAG: GreA/GreB family elongation factor [Glaciecola sp.]|jgi:transcription elongation GreA/GreB family factor|nr:GreA/GreB family elongation factor [Glaciecola sp.]MDG2099596.1 GreA/GreB family elongation factor [Glaciecola sp.]
MSYKAQLIKHVIANLEQVHTTAVNAAKHAHDMATDKQNIPENKYDTLGLESGYLAQGQANRAAEYLVELDAMKHIPVKDFIADDIIAIGALVGLCDQHDASMWVFLAPVSGGMTFEFEHRNIMVISARSPLGQQLLGKEVYDECHIGQGTHSKHYRITDIV